MIKICTCGMEMNFQEFINYILFNCENCKSLFYEEKTCDHEFMPINFEIDGGKFQVRKLCKICYYIDSKALKQSDFNNLPIKNLAKAHEYRNNLDIQFRDRLKYYQIRYHEQFKSKYDNYLRSDNWKIKRESILLRDKYVCQICGNMAGNVHHLTYRHLENEYKFELVSLCEKCHILHYHK